MSLHQHPAVSDVMRFCCTGLTEFPDGDYQLINGGVAYIPKVKATPAQMDH